MDRFRYVDWEFTCLILGLVLVALVIVLFLVDVGVYVTHEREGEVVRLKYRDSFWGEEFTVHIRTASGDVISAEADSTIWYELEEGQTVVYENKYGIITHTLHEYEVLRHAD